MWPTLVSIGPLAIQSFGFVLAASVFFGGFVWWQKGREEGFDEEELMDIWLLAGVLGLVFGRGWYILANWDFFSGSFYKMMFLTKYPGLAYEGVWIGAVLMILIQVIKKKWNFFKLAETGLFAFLIVEMFGWLGSFLAGSSIGKMTTWWWGIKFPGVDGKRIPVQLFFIVSIGLLFKIIKSWEKEYRSFKWYKSEKGEAKSGFLVACYLIGLGLLTLLLGFFQQLPNILWIFSSRQLFGIAMFLSGSLLLLERSGITIKKARKQEPKKPVVSKIERNKKVKLTKKRRKKGFDFK